MNSVFYAINLYVHAQILQFYAWFLEGFFPNEFSLNLNQFI